jgi:hypothetical protein
MLAERKIAMHDGPSQMAALGQRTLAVNVGAPVDRCSLHDITAKFKVEIM